MPCQRVTILAPDFRVGSRGLTLVETLVVIGVIAVLWVAAPSIGNVLGVARDSTAQWQERRINSAYNQYLANGGAPAVNLEEAVQVLAEANTTIPQTISSSEGELELAFENQIFAYVPSGSSDSGDGRELVGTSPLILNVKRSGGTATYGGHELPGVGSIPSFMLKSSSGEFQFYNSGGYEGLDLHHSLQDFLADLEPSADRFNPSSSKILSLEKDGARYDLDFILWDEGQQLRLLSVAKYE